MKFAVVIVFMLGLLAAGSAAILVKNLHLGQSAVGQSPTIVEVIVAAKELPVATVLRPEHVQKEKVPVLGLPRDCCTSPVQAIGRVLSVGVLQGQALRRGYFVPDSGPAASVATIPAGMRVFTISVSSRSINPELLYPGCFVDVQATFDLASVSRGEAIATTVLHRIQVHAVEDEVVAAPQSADNDKTGKAGKVARSTAGHSGAVRISLLVDTKQLKTLQLASERGTIALAICSPTDTTPVEQAGTVYDKKFLHDLGLPEEAPVPQAAPPDANVPAPAPVVQPPPSWDMELIQGQDRSRISVPVKPATSDPGG